MKNLTLLIALSFITLFTSCKKGDEPTPFLHDVKYYRLVDSVYNYQNGNYYDTIYYGYIHNDGLIYVDAYNGVIMPFELIPSDKQDVLKGVYNDSINVISPAYNPSIKNDKPTWVYYKSK